MKGIKHAIETKQHRDVLLLTGRVGSGSCEDSFDLSDVGCSLKTDNSAKEFTDSSPANTLTGITPLHFLPV